MTPTSSAIWETTPKSCVMSRMAAPRSRRSPSSWCRICACTVTSRAAVGSSAMMRSGSSAVAMPIMTRWHMPPDSWKGSDLATRWGSGRPSRARMATASARASRFRIPRCAVSASATWSPTGRTGLRPATGSWKIMATRRPRMARSPASRMASRSAPSKAISPERTSASSGRRRGMAAPTVLLPAPDSPTSANTRPRSMSKETPSTAWAVASRVR